MDTRELTDRLLASYQNVGGINHLDGKNLPSRQAIGRITTDLLRLLFPGFFDESAIATAAVKAATSELLDEVAVRLRREIARSLEYAPPPSCPTRIS
jgi:serine O-acetyltransferase